MNAIKQADLVQSVADALQFISYYHPADYIRALARAYDREQSPAAKDAIAQILTNSRMCAEGHRPICQDTGIVNVFMKVGMDLRWDAEMSVEDMVNEGVRRAYSNPDNVLRASVAGYCIRCEAVRPAPEAATAAPTPASAPAVGRKATSKPSKKAEPALDQTAPALNDPSVKGPVPTGLGLVSVVGSLTFCQMCCGTM